jgi:hypothetical protein
VRGTLVGKARGGVPLWYKLSALQGNELKEAVDWLLEDDTFLHDGIDMEVSFLCLEIDDTYHTTPMHAA